MTTADLYLLKQHVDQVYLLVTTNSSLTELQIKVLRDYCIELHKLVHCVVLPKVV